MHRVNRQFRLTSAADFKRVRRTGKSYAHPLGVLIACPSDTLHTRYGVTAGRAVGGAVHRNRAKRRLREALRSLSPAVQAGWDVVVIARPGLNEAEWPELLAALEQLLRRARIIDNEK